MARKTVLNSLHREYGGRMVEFAGWELPLHFGSQVEEHHRVRREAGMFDVSHMSLTDLDGADAPAFLRRLCANDTGRLVRPGLGLYTCLLDEAGGILDDAIVYRTGDTRFRLVSNAATRDKIAAWLERQAAAHPALRIAVRPDLAMIAAQGPTARARVETCLPAPLRTEAAALPPFGCAEMGEWLVSRTGYTGEDGYEIQLPVEAAPGLWRALAAAGVAVCGLGARDTLRLEAGLRLYGADMDESVTPLESGLAWTVAFAPEERDFIGRAALEAQRRRGGLRRCAGLVLEAPGVMRGGQRVVVPGIGEGVVTSGIYAPTLGRSVAFARLPPGGYERAWVEIRDQRKAARVGPTRFLSQVARMG